MSAVNWDGKRSYLVIFRPVNDRRDSERLLRENEARLRLITDNIPVCVAYADRSERIQFSNPAFAKWVNLPLENIIGMHLRDIREPGW